MRRELVYLPGVGADFLAGYNYYEHLSPGRGGARFESAFKRALEKIAAGLVIHAPAFEEFHRVHLEKYPYTLYYRMVGERAVITAVLYSRYDPVKIETILKSRG